MYLILKSTLCLFLFWGFYKLFLEREKIFVFNRFYLLSGLIMSFIIPFITIEIEGNTTVETILATETTGIYTIVQQETFYDKLIDLLPFIYGGIVFLLMIRLGINIYKVVAKTSSLPTKYWQQAKLVFINQSELPHAFLKYIFLNKNDFDKGKIESELLVHELQHVRQRHSYDIILVEIIKAILWFNPLIHLFEKAIKLNHEFLADEAVIRQTTSIKSYQYLLLAKARYSVNHSYLASSINYLITKKRLEMMTKKTSYFVAFAKKGLAIALMIVLCFSLSNHVIAQTENGASESMIKEYKELMKKYTPKDGESMSIYEKDVNRINEIYNEMSVEQRKKYPKIDLPPPPPPVLNVKTPKAPKAKEKEKTPKAKVKEKSVTPITPVTPVTPVTPKVVKGVESTKAVKPMKLPETPKTPVVKGYEGSIPPPPPPIDLKDFTENDTYYVNGEKTSYEKAKKTIENGGVKIKYKGKKGERIINITTD